MPVPWRRFILAVACGAVATAFMVAGVRAGGVLVLYDRMRDVAKFLTPRVLPVGVSDLVTDLLVGLVLILPGLVVTAFAALRGFDRRRTRCSKCGHELTGITSGAASDSGT
jgi:hypothetical protein